MDDDVVLCRLVAGAAFPGSLATANPGVRVSATRRTRLSMRHVLPALRAPEPRGSARFCREVAGSPGALLAGSLAATNLVPALLFEPWIDGQTIAPAVVDLAVGPADARGQAAVLALCAIASNLAALRFAWLSSALPRCTRSRLNDASIDHGRS